MRASPPHRPKRWKRSLPKTASQAPRTTSESRPPSETRCVFCESGSVTRRHAPSRVPLLSHSLHRVVLTTVHKLVADARHCFAGCSDKKLVHPPPRVRQARGGHKRRGGAARGEAGARGGGEGEGRRSRSSPPEGARTSARALLSSRSSHDVVKMRIFARVLLFLGLNDVTTLSCSLKTTHTLLSGSNLHRRVVPALHRPVGAGRAGDGARRQRGHRSEARGGGGGAQEGTRRGGSSSGKRAHRGGARGGGRRARAQIAAGVQGRQRKAVGRGVVYPFHTCFSFFAPPFSGPFIPFPFCPLTLSPSLPGAVLLGGRVTRPLRGRRRGVVFGG